MWRGCWTELGDECGWSWSGGAGVVEQIVDAGGLGVAQLRWPCGMGMGVVRLIAIVKERRARGSVESCDIVAEKS